MKKFLIFISAVLISTLAWGVGAVFAQAPATPRDPDVMSVYSSEPTGAGDEVYHFTACRKSRSYAPLRCGEETKNIAPAQCEVDGKLQSTVLIKGCKKQPAEYVDPTTKYYEKVNVAKFGQKKPGGCADDPEKQAYYYAPEWVVGVNSGYYFDVKGTITFGNQETNDPKSIDSGASPLIEKIVKDGVALPLYRPTLCKTWDELADKKSASKEVQDELEAAKKKMGDFLTKDNITSIKDKLKEAGCNNDNNNIDGSLPYNDVPAVSCSVRERISGKSGIEIFSKYMGAIYKWFASIAGIIAVLIIVFSGVQISAAGENSEDVTKAKTRIAQTIAGLAILFLSGLILYAINPNFFTG